MASSRSRFYRKFRLTEKLKCGIMEENKTEGGPDAQEDRLENSPASGRTGDGREALGRGRGGQVEGHSQEFPGLPACGGGHASWGNHGRQREARGSAASRRKAGGSSEAGRSPDSLRFTTGPIPDHPGIVRYFVRVCGCGSEIRRGPPKKAIDLGRGDYEISRPQEGLPR